VAKLFFDAHHAVRDAARDAAGIAALAENNIPAPLLLCETASLDGQVQVLIYERIYEALSLDEAWRNRDNAIEMMPLLRPVVVEIATQHVLGIVQHDLHLNNFLLTKKKIYTLDGAQIERKPPLLPKKESMKNLALFLSQLGVGVTTCQEQLFKVYAEARGWQVKADDLTTLFLFIKQWDQKRWQRYERKIFRNCTHFLRLKFWCQDGMVDRHYCFPELNRVLKEPDSAFLHASAMLLKDGHSSTVVKVTLDNKDYVVKRYNVKSIWHFLRRALRETRATRSWRLSHKLNLFGIATAKPVAFIEQRILGVHGKSYFIAEYISAEHVGDYLVRHKDDGVRVESMLERTAALLKNLAKLEMTHGDLKMTNILINADEQPVFIDLDGAAEHATLSGLRQAWDKEIERFLRNFSNMPGIIEKFKAAFAIS
jgi:tRNA A-37 threonylcarbamoyl transferase component Bud32